MAGTRLETVFSYAILALFSLAVVLPVGWLLLAATSPKANAGVDLENIRLANFADAWVQADFTTHLLNSLIICVGAVVITSTVSILAGYGLTDLGHAGQPDRLPDHPGRHHDPAGRDPGSPLLQPA